MDLLKVAADLLLEAPEDHDPEEEKALDFVAKVPGMSHYPREVMRGMMRDAIKKYGGVHQANRALQQQNTGMRRQIKQQFADLHRAHGQSLAQRHPQWNDLVRQVEGWD
jgi:hypothetical protein